MTLKLFFSKLCLGGPNSSRPSWKAPGIYLHKTLQEWKEERPGEAFSLGAKCYLIIF